MWVSKHLQHDGVPNGLPKRMRNDLRHSLSSVRYLTLFTPACHNDDINVLFFIQHQSTSDFATPKLGN